MTNNPGEAAGGPSLSQAHTSSSTTAGSTRHNHNHNHNHDHSHKHNHQHLHLHQRRRLHPPGQDETAPHARSPSPPPTEKLHGREVVVVQTVSVVKFIDASGTVTSVETITSSSAHAALVQPTSLDIPAVVTAGLSALGNLLPSVSLSGLLPGTSDGASSTATPAALSVTASSSQSASDETLTSTPSSSSSAFPTLSLGIFNSSSSHIPTLFSNHTSALYSNRTRTSSSFPSTFASTITASSHSAHLTSVTHLNLPTDVAGGSAGSANGNGGAAGGATATYAPVQPTTDSTSSGLTPETRNAVVGGVVGSVAGLALIAFVLLYLLKWKNKRGQGIMLLGDADNTTRGRAFSSGGPSSPRSGGGGGGGASMAERSGAFAIPAALAKLSSGGGKQRALGAPLPDFHDQQQPPPTQEKGFYRVSGRKLISVLESGGDGYSDPHDSMSSAASHSRHSHYYRDSEAFTDNPGGLQLGSPMRPVSGVPIFRDGPQRTPVHEYGPLPSPGQRPAAFNNNGSTNTLPAPAAADGFFGGGPRSLTSRDGSRGSASRFTEEDT